MFQGPLVLRDVFNTAYQVFAIGECGQAHTAAIRKIFNDPVAATGFLSQFDLSGGHWRQLLAGQELAHGYFSSSSLKDQLIGALVRGAVTFYALPDINTCAIAHSGNGKAYVFIRGPQSLPHIEGDCLSFRDAEQAKVLVHSLNANAAYWLRVLDNAGLAQGVAHQSARHVQGIIVDYLANQSLRAYEFPYRPQQRARGEGALETEPLRPNDKTVPPPPPAETKLPPPLAERRGVAPKSLNDAANRLNSMSEVIASEGYQAKYSDKELVDQAQQGDVAKERYHVRFMEKDYLWAYGSADKSADNLTGALGREMEGVTGKGPKYWSTTFDQIEDADTDPKLISEKLGLDYEPHKKFVLIVVDTEKAQPLTGVDSVAATFENVSAFSNRELPDEFPQAFTDEVMNDAFQAKYAEHYQKAVDSGDLEHQWSTNTKRFGQYLDATDVNTRDKSLMIKRMQMHREVGNNQLYEGNGLTKNIIKGSDSKYGAVETLNFERKQSNLQQLRQSNAIKVIELG